MTPVSKDHHKRHGELGAASLLSGCTTAACLLPAVPTR
jgi:hypothetical protein